MKDNCKEQLRDQCAKIAKQIETGEYDFAGEIDSEYPNAFDHPNAFDYLSDALDIEYVRDSQGNYRGAIVLVAFGGPNIWIDTRWKEVRGAWWSDSCTVPYHRDELGLDDALEELMSY